jgi:hypothetical protein
MTMLCIAVFCRTVFLSQNHILQNTAFAKHGARQLPAAPNVSENPSGVNE